MRWLILALLLAGCAGVSAQPRPTVTPATPTPRGDYDPGVMFPRSPYPAPLAAPTAPAPTLTATRTPAGIVVTWASPDYGCVRLTGINLDDMIACGQSGSVLLDAGQAQYAGVGRSVGLWGGSGWLVAPVPLPGYVQALPGVASGAP